MRTTPAKCAASQVHASRSRGKSCVIVTHLLAAIAPLLGSNVSAAPIRSGKDWAIIPLVTPADWQALIQPENLAAGKRVQAEPPPNDWNTGSDLGQLTDGVLAGAEGRMWSDKRAVGWAYQTYARLKLDLGQSRPLGQVVLRLQVINKDNTIPWTITAARATTARTARFASSRSARGRRTTRT